MIVNGYALVFHQALIGQLETLAEGCELATKRDGHECKADANVELLAALAKLILEIVPADPNRRAYYLGGTLGDGYDHWRRVTLFGRLRLFFHFDSRMRRITYAWIHDARPRHQDDRRRDPYKTFQRMLESGSSPRNWATLARRSRTRVENTG